MQKKSDSNETSSKVLTVPDKDTENKYNVQNKSDSNETSSEEFTVPDKEPEKEREIEDNLQKSLDEGYSSEEEPAAENPVEHEDKSSNKEQDTAKAEATEKCETESDNKSLVKTEKKPVSTGSIKAANQIVNKARSSVKGSWHKTSKNWKKDKILHTQYYCSDRSCKVVKGSKMAMLQHIKEAHKDYRFKCCHCIQKYQSLAARTKHGMYHKMNYHYVCAEVTNCRKGLMFLCVYTEHLKTHTKKILWKCKYNGCDKAYVAKRMCTAHYKTHFSQDVTGDEKLVDGSTCGQTCVSDNHLKQHKRGKHSEGWKAYCGEKFLWPAGKYAHQKKW